MNLPTSSAFSQLLLDKFLKAVRQKSRYGNEDNQQLNSEIMENIEHFPKILNEVITQLQKEKIHISKARMIAATACEMMELYALNHVYQEGEEENLKRVIKLLGFLILGAVKTPTTGGQTTPPPTPTASDSHADLPVFTVEKPEKYSTLALKVVNQIFANKNLDTEIMLMIASFYCVDWQTIQSQSFPRLQRLLVALNFDNNFPDYNKAVMLLKKVGLRQMIGLAEFQYRKQNYIQMKSKLDNLSSLENQKMTVSPLELIKEHLDTFYYQLNQNIRNATASMISMGGSKLDFDSTVKAYWNYDRLLVGIAEKSVIIFKTLVAINCDGIFWNEQVKKMAQSGIGFNAKSQTLFKETRQQWVHELNNLVNLTLTSQNVKTSQVGRLKKNILDWPLSSFFAKNPSDTSKISQTVIKEKLEKQPILDTANLLILFHSNIKETTNPLGQVLSLYAALVEQLSTYKRVREWTTNYLEQYGFSSTDIIEILESRQD